VIARDGVYLDPGKTKKVEKYPTTTDVTTLRQFLGLAYYRCFVPHFAKIAALLHLLTKKNAVLDWTKQLQFCHTLSLVTVKGLYWKQMTAIVGLSAILS